MALDSRRRSDDFGRATFVSVGLIGKCPREHGVRRRRDSCGGLTQEQVSRPSFLAKYALLCFVTTTFSPLPTDLASAHAMILAQREMLEQKQSELTLARSDAKVRAREIERLKLLLAKARRERFGQSSERGKLIVEQVELAIEDLEETQGEEEAKAEIAAPAATELLQYSLDPGIAGGDFLLVDVVKRHRLLQDEQGARRGNGRSGPSRSLPRSNGAACRALSPAQPGRARRR